MRFIGQLVVVLAMAAAARAQSAPASEEQKITLGEITRKALGYTRSLPNYVCTQVTRRSVDRTGTGKHWRPVDKIQEQLTYFDQREHYKIAMIDDKVIDNPDHDQLAGVRSSGEFGTTLFEIFDPETQTEFHWDRWTWVDGKQMYVFAFRVSQARSNYRIFHETSGRRIVAGYHGLVYADRKAKAVMRIVMECDDMPSDFPVQSIKTDLWYALTMVSGQEFVLPFIYELTSREGAYLARNEAEFREYRKFTSDATIRFDSPDDNAH